MQKIFPIVCGLFVLAGLILSGINPYHRGTWFLEIFPVLLAAPVVLFTYKRFPLTSLLYACICLHALVLELGGAYTYARVPLGFWLQDVFSFSRNPYDRIGHFMQGFVPCLVAREVLWRLKKVSGLTTLNWFALCIALAVSAFYELIEWWAAIALGKGADEFLATQGDVWDKQWDMFMALIGALVAIFIFGKLHNRMMAKLKTS